MTIERNVNLDYQRYTTVHCTPDRMADLLDLEFVPRGYGGLGYRQALECVEGGVTIYFDGAVEGMGVHVDITGQGCRLIESRPYFGGWPDFFKWMRAEGAKWTRLDIFYDHFGHDFTVQTVADAVNNGDMSCRARRVDRTQALRGGCGDTLMIGARGGETMVRCYDKAAQIGESGPWVRMEFEYRKKKADAVAKLLADGRETEALGVCRSFVEFKEPGQSDTCVTRRKVAGWWERLIESPKFCLGLSKYAQQSVQKTMVWVHKFLGPTLAMLTDVCEGDLTPIIESVVDGAKRMNRRQKKMVAAYRAEIAAIKAMPSDTRFSVQMPLAWGS